MANFSRLKISIRLGRGGGGGGGAEILSRIYDEFQPGR